LSIEFLAAASLVGIKPGDFLHANDDIELRCLILVAEQAMEYHQIELRNHAAMIIQFLGKAMGSE